MPKRSNKVEDIRVSPRLKGLPSPILAEILGGSQLTFDSADPKQSLDGSMSANSVTSLRPEEPQWTAAQRRKAKLRAFIKAANKFLV